MVVDFCKLQKLGIAVSRISRNCLYFLLVIGRGGEQVSRIQSETGCKVQVAPDNGTGKDRPCYLQGSKEAIEYVTRYH